MDEQHYKNRLLKIMCIWYSIYLSQGFTFRDSKKKYKGIINCFEHILHDGKGVMFYGYSGKKKDTIKIILLLINPSCRGQSVADNLLGKLCEIAIKNNIKKIYWNININDSNKESLHSFAEKYFVSEGDETSQGNVVTYRKYAIYLENENEKPKC